MDSIVTRVEKEETALFDLVLWFHVIEQMMYRMFCLPWDIPAQYFPWLLLLIFQLYSVQPRCLDLFFYHLSYSPTEKIMCLRSRNIYSHSKF